MGYAEWLTLEHIHVLAVLRGREKVELKIERFELLCDKVSVEPAMHVR